MVDPCWTGEPGKEFVTDDDSKIGEDVSFVDTRSHIFPDSVTEWGDEGRRAQAAAAREAELRAAAAAAEEQAAADKAKALSVVSYSTAWALSV